MKPVLRILLVEDDARFASLVSALLEAAAFEVIYVPNASSARRALAERPPDLSVIDLGLPDDDGICLLRDVVEATRAPVLVLSAARAASTIVDAMRAGASGYLAKEDVARRLVVAIEELLAGGIPLSRDAARAMLEAVRGPDAECAESSGIHEVSLTARELDVLAELARGITYEQVGLVLGVSANTVRSHVKTLYAKLDASSRTEAVMQAVRLGLVRAS